MKKWLSRRKRYEELSASIEEHLAEKIDELIEGGLSREEATYAARRAFGNATRIEEQSREVWQWPRIESLWADVKFALRQLAKSPGFAITAVLTIMLGIGANIAVFSIVDAVLMKPLPYRNADRLVMIAETLPKERVPAFDTFREFEQWSRYSNSFEAMAAATWAGRLHTIFSWHGENQEILAVPVSGNFFSMLGVRAAHGRTFEAADVNSTCTVVLAHSFWQERLGGSPDWIGKSLTLNHESCTIVGVMPEKFSFYPKETKLWTLITSNSEFTQKPWEMPVLAFGLLKPGVSRSAAQAELASIQSRIIAENPGLAAMNLEPLLADLQSEFTWLTGRNLHRGLIILFAVVGFILLIACANVANLLLGRAIVRQKELGVRAALGAGRSRLIRQLLTESMVLSLLGSGLGIPLAIICIRYITMKEAMQLPPGAVISVNWEVLCFALILAFVTGVLFGLLPAWKASRMDLNEVLKQSASTASRAAGSHRASRSLVVTEMALSLIVLVAAGLLVRSMIRLTTAPLGYERHGLLTAKINLPASAYPTPDDWSAFWDRLELKLDSLPGVQGVAIAPSLAASLGTSPVTIDEAGSSQRVVSASNPEPVSGAYFQVAGIPLLQGREFSDVDRSNSIPVAIVSQSFARKFFPNGTALSRRIKPGQPDSSKHWLTIVGIVGDVSRPTLFMGYSQDSSVYRPLPQAPEGSLSVFIRAAGDPRAVEAEVGSAIVATDPNLPLPAIETINESLSWFTAEPRFRAELFSLFSALALLLAAVGIYGVLSQRVSQRTQEIGIRVALGARRDSVLMLIIGEGLRLALIGITIGVAGSLAITRFFSAMLYGVTSTDPLTFTAVSLLLMLVALLACCVPARRAMKVDPMQALRNE